MPIISSGSTAQQMCNVCNEVREAFSLDWDNFIVYFSDNTNSMIGKRNSFLQEIRSAQGDQKIFDFDCPYNLAHLCAGKGAKEFSVNVEDFVIDKYYHFRRSAKRKKQLREFLNVNNNEVRKVINHVSSRWLNLGKYLRRCSGTPWDSLMQWDSLESFFLSNFDLDDGPTENDPNEKPNREKRFVNALFTQPVRSCMLCSSSL